MFWIDRSPLRTSLLLALLLGACAEKPLPPSDPRLAWPITLGFTEKILALDAIDPDGALTAPDVGRLAAFLDRYGAGRRGRLTLVSGALPIPAAERLAAEISLVARHRGLLETGVTRAALPGPAPRLILTLATAEGPDCRAAAAQTAGAWPFGCAHQRNLAAMVQEPLDLIAPEPLAAAETARLMTVLDAYRKGDSTSSKRGESERLSVSKVSP